MARLPSPVAPEAPLPDPFSSATEKFNAAGRSGGLGSPASREPRALGRAVKKPPSLEHPAPYQALTFGGFELVCGGNRIHASRTIQKKPLELLKVLISLGGKEVPREKLTDILWPDADGDAAVRAFDTTIHRLRRYLGADTIIRLRNGYLDIDDRYLWVDGLIFEEVLGRHKIPRAGTLPREKDIPWIEEALGWYRGDFLPDEFRYPEVTVCRERLRHKYFLGVLQVGRYWELKNTWAHAADWYQKALEIEDLAEDLYKKLMICYLRMNRRAEALSVYRRCRNVMTHCLKNSPSDEIQALYKSLL